MISTRLAAAVAAGVLVVGILVGSAGAVLLGGTTARGGDGWGPGTNGMMRGSMMGGNGSMMMGGHGSMMMGGSWSRDQMLDQMREHMGWPAASPASDGDGQ